MAKKKTAKKAKKKTSKSTKNPAGSNDTRFQKGNPGGPGGARAGAGRKKAAVRANLEHVYAQSTLSESISPEVILKLKLGDYSQKTPLQIAHQNLMIALCDNVGGLPTEFALDAGKTVMDRVYGRPKQTVDLSTNDRDMDRRLSKVEGELLRRMGTAAIAALEVGND